MSDICPICYNPIRTSSQDGTFTDDPLLSPNHANEEFQGVCMVRDKHILELQQKVNEYELTFGITLTLWSTVDLVRGKHINELREAIENMLSTFGVSLGDFLSSNKDGIPQSGYREDWLDGNRLLDDSLVRCLHIEQLRKQIYGNVLFTTTVNFFGYDGFDTYNNDGMIPYLEAAGSPNTLVKNSIEEPGDTKTYHNGYSNVTYFCDNINTNIIYRIGQNGNITKFDREFKKIERDYIYLSDEDTFVNTYISSVSIAISENSKDFLLYTCEYTSERLGKPDVLWENFYLDYEDLPNYIASYTSPRLRLAGFGTGNSNQSISIKNCSDIIWSNLVGNEDHNDITSTDINILVDGEKWQQVSSFVGRTEIEKVYKLDIPSGLVTFAVGGGMPPLNGSTIDAVFSLVASSYNKFIFVSTLTDVSMSRPINIKYTKVIASRSSRNKVYAVKVTDPINFFIPVLPDIHTSFSNSSDVQIKFGPSRSWQYETYYWEGRVNQDATVTLSKPVDFVFLLGNGVVKSEVGYDILCSNNNSIDPGTSYNPTIWEVSGYFQDKGEGPNAHVGELLSVTNGLTKYNPSGATKNDVSISQDNLSFTFPSGTGHSILDASAASAGIWINAINSEIKQYSFTSKSQCRILFPYYLASGSSSNTYLNSQEQRFVLKSPYGWTDSRFVNGTSAPLDIDFYVYQIGSTVIDPPTSLGRPGYRAWSDAVYNWYTVSFGYGIWHIVVTPKTQTSGLLSLSPPTIKVKVVYGEYAWVCFKEVFGIDIRRVEYFKISAG